jgi:hypothetical protein
MEVYVLMQLSHPHGGKANHGIRCFEKIAIKASLEPME